MIFGFRPNSAGAFVRSEGLAPASDLRYDQLYDRYARQRDGSPAMPRPRTRTNLAGICIATLPATPNQAGEGGGTHK